MSSSYNLIRTQQEYTKAKNDKDFMLWLARFEPDYRTEFWERNIVAMHHAYLEGIKQGAKNELRC